MTRDVTQIAYSAARGEGDEVRGRADCRRRQHEAHGGWLERSTTAPSTTLVRSAHLTPGHERQAGGRGRHARNDPTASEIPWPYPGPPRRVRIGRFSSQPDGKGPSSHLPRPASAHGFPYLFEAAALRAPAALCLMQPQVLARGVASGRSPHGTRLRLPRGALRMCCDALD